jgi:hypothetical protein
MPSARHPSHQDNTILTTQTAMHDQSDNASCRSLRGPDELLVAALRGLARGKDRFERDELVQAAVGLARRDEQSIQAVMHRVDAFLDDSHWVRQVPDPKQCVFTSRVVAMNLEALLRDVPLGRQSRAHVVSSEALDKLVDLRAPDCLLHRSFATEGKARPIQFGVAQRLAIHALMTGVGESWAHVRRHVAEESNRPVAAPRACRLGLQAACVALRVAVLSERPT